jgi:hypothetical protein
VVLVPVATRVAAKKVAASELETAAVAAADWETAAATAAAKNFSSATGSCQTKHKNSKEHHGSGSEQIEKKDNQSKKISAPPKKRGYLKESISSSSNSGSGSRTSDSDSSEYTGNFSTNKKKNY